MTAERSRRSPWIWAISFVAISFGLLTIRAGDTVLFGSAAARSAAGHYVPFVLWFNFLAGFAYVIAGVGLWLERRWAAWLAIACMAVVLVWLWTRPSARPGRTSGSGGAKRPGSSPT